jgi:hypothetical protein
MVFENRGEDQLPGRTQQRIATHWPFQTICQAPAIRYCQQVSWRRGGPLVRYLSFRLSGNSLGRFERLDYRNRFQAGVPEASLRVTVDEPIAIISAIAPSGIGKFLVLAPYIQHKTNPTFLHQ